MLGRQGAAGHGRGTSRWKRVRLGEPPGNHDRPARVSKGMRRRLFRVILLRMTLGLSVVTAASPAAWQGGTDRPGSQILAALASHQYDMDCV
jgi:hypothetical protein